MKVLITGATGLVGKKLVSLLKANGYQVRQLTTRREMTSQEGFYYWNPVTGEMNPGALKEVDAIIHLAGSSIGAGRWTAKRKKDILDSRTQSTELLYQKAVEMKVQLKVFISASATGYYGGKTSETIYDEYSPPGTDFLAKVCVEWEKAADRFQKAGIRTVKLRMGVVLAKGAPALRKMLLPIRFGIGSPLGNGRQYMPWIQLDDLCRMYLRVLEDESLSGVYNAVAPQHITNRQLMKNLAEKLKKPFFFPPVPAFVLKMMLGEMAIIITDGSRVVPRRIAAAGFEYAHPTMETLELD
jgi:uncharacterized protein (TIGR01777 family)